MENAMEATRVRGLGCVGYIGHRVFMGFINILGFRVRG